MIAFSCPHCKVQLQVKESRAGTTAPCPSCSGVVQAPGTALSPSGSGGDQRSDVHYSQLPTLRLSGTGEDTDPSLPKLAPPKEYPFLAPPEAPDEMGRLGHYAVLKVLGTGAMGVVFQAQDLHLKRLVALKVVKPSLAAYADSHRRFLREAQLAASIDHEHIVTIYQVGEDRGVLFLAMKLLQGESLDRRLNRSGGRLPLAEVLRIGREMAEGLAAAHARELIHRDIKPANIWLETDRNRVKIVDFGLACGTAEDGRLTQAGAVIGTPSYMAPEQANAKELDSRCDLFSLGAVLYQMSTGTLPFGGKDTLSVLAALASKTPAAPHKIVPSLPREFTDLVMGLLEKDRTERVQTAKEVIKAIEALESTPVRPTTQETPAETPITEIKSRSQGSAVTSAVGSKARLKDKYASADRSKSSKKTQIAGDRRKLRPQGVWTASRIIFVVSIVLLSIALVVFLIGVIRHSNRPRTAIPIDPPAHQASILLNGETQFNLSSIPI